MLATEVLMGDIDQAAEKLSEAQARNFQRWPVLGEYVWPNAPGWEERTTFEAEVAHLKSWLAARLVWMDSALF